MTYATPAVARSIEAAKAVALFLRLLLHPRKKPENEQVGWLECSHRDVIKVFVPLYDMAADHRAELIHGDPELFGGFRLRVLGFPRSC